MMIELIIKEHLERELKVEVGFEMGFSQAGQFVIVEKVGSSRTNYIDHSSFAIQSYADTMYKAAKLNYRVKAAMEKLIEDGNIASVVLDSDYNFTDTTTKKYRYQAVYDITHY
ncbi:MAG: hypothetical protein SPI59_01350 [Finegoldia sp.]|nr:hypothetical protein [Bacteroidaceae bacterium]MDY6064955.1 hypothetical protein [Finegoldia sp.]